MQWVIDWAHRLGYTQEADVRHVVVLGTFAYLGLVMTLGQGFLVRRMAGRVSEKSMAIGGTLVSTLSLILLSVAVQQEGFGLLCLAMAIFVVGLAFVTPASQCLISRRTQSPSNKDMCWA